MCIGCLALSIEPMTTAYIVISVKTVLNILLPRFSLGIEKKEEISLIEDTGVKYWLYFLLLWAITNVDRNNNTNWEIYNQALPFFISDPSAAMVGRTTFTSEKIILWRNKSLQGTFMVILTAYALNKSIKLSISIGLVELFGCEYDNALIGGLLLANLLKQKYF